MRVVTVSLLCLLAATRSVLVAAADAPPNVVLILSDDQSWTDYGFMGHPDIRTPHLDRLAAESAVFTNGYVPVALCRPSLASIITGLPPREHGITGNDVALPAERPKGWSRARDPAYLARSEALIAKIDAVPTLPRWLAAKGYRSHQSGKWWEGNFARGGFSAGMTHGDPARGGRHGDDGLVIGREGLAPVLDFIDRCGDAPFLVWYAPFLPHTPHDPPERLLAKYRSAERPLALARYFAMCEWFDETCGQLLAHLDTRGLTTRTLVIFVADNGWIQRTRDTDVPDDWSESFAPRSKQSPHDGGVRTPILVRWPGHAEPRRHQALASSLDIAPTVLAACGVTAPGTLRGVDLLGVAAGKVPGREALFGEQFAHDIADIADPEQSLIYRWCRTERWKFIRRYEGTIGRYGAVLRANEAYPQLYEIAADPHETRNLAASRPEVVAELTRRLDAEWKPAHGKPGDARSTAK